MCNLRLDLRGCEDNEVIQVSFYDKKRNVVLGACLFVLDPKETIINLVVQREGDEIRLYRFLGTKIVLVPLLEDQIATDGTMNMELWPSFEQEAWEVRGFQRRNDPVEAMRLRLEGTSIRTVQVH